MPVVRVFIVATVLIPVGQTPAPMAFPIFRVDTVAGTMFAHIGWAMSGYSNQNMLAISIAILFAVCGCRSGQEKSAVQFSKIHHAVPKTISPDEDHRPSLGPSQISATLPDEYWIPPNTSDTDLPEQVPITLDEILQLALTDTAILRSLGAQLVADPRTANGIFDPAIIATDPNLGIEAALAQFDANFSASINHANNDDVFNNSILGGGATEVVQDLTTSDLLLQKTAATGTQYRLRNNIIYDSNNNPFSAFPSSYAAFVEAQMRQPLLQGSGLAFNGIAGPNSRPGFLNTSGVIISRINHDVSIASFQKDVRDYVFEVINAYWQLYFAYANFDSLKTNRDAALETWKYVKARFDNDLPGGEADKEAQAREQYFLFQERLLTSLNGDSRTGIPGVLQAESNLRRLLGLPQNDGRLIYPADHPMTSKTVYDWYAMVAHTLENRIELRQQAFQIRKRELELLASRNFTLPRLDAVATFRNNGFGDDLTGGSGRFSSALKDMASGDHNEWELGMQLNVPIGFRQAYAGVRNYELKLIREKSVLVEQQKQILHELGSAVRQTDQSYNSMELAFNRIRAASDVVESRAAAFQSDTVPLNFLLEGQRRLAEAEIEYHRARIAFQIANESVSLQSGRLLASHAICLDADAPELALETCRSRWQLLRRSQRFDYRY